MATPSFHQLRVLAFESRRAKEIATLIETYGGRSIVAPALREVALESNTEALAFGAGVLRDEFDVVIFLTGVGTRFLLSVIERAHSRAEFLAALARTRVVARGPKPVAVLRELQVPIWVTAPEPNTWRELLAAVDAKAGDLSLSGARVAVQEYGVTNADLVAGLESRGANVTRVPVYQWDLPVNVAPLEDAVRALSRRDIDVVLFTSTVQATHLWQVVDRMHQGHNVRAGLANAVVASIGPTTSEGLREAGLPVDLEASHPKMGMLVREAAEQAAALLSAKRA